MENNIEIEIYVGFTLLFRRALRNFKRAGMIQMFNKETREYMIQGLCRDVIPLVPTKQQEDMVT